MMRLTLRVAAAGLLGVAAMTVTHLLAACGNDDDNAAPGADASTDANLHGDGSSLGDAAASGDGGANDASVVDAAGTAFDGRFDVSFYQTSFTSDAGTSYTKRIATSAYFGDDDPDGLTCVRSVVHTSCISLVCTRTPDAGTTNGGGASDASLVPATAGDIRITGGSEMIDGGLEVDPSLNTGVYTPTPATLTALDDTTLPYIKAGDHLTVTAAGNPEGIGPFTATLAAVTPVTVLQPVFTVPVAGDSGAYPVATTRISASSDLVIAWSNDAAPNSSIMATLETITAATGAQQYLECTFDAGAGSQGTMPLSALATPFPPVDGVKVVGQLYITPWTTTTLTAGNAGGSASDPGAWTVYADVLANTVSGSFTTTQ